MPVLRKLWSCMLVGGLFATPIAGQVTPFALGYVRADGRIAPKLIYEDGTWSTVEWPFQPWNTHAWQVLRDSRTRVTTSGELAVSPDDLYEAVLVSDHPAVPDQPWRPTRISVAATSALEFREFENHRDDPPSALLERVKAEFERTLTTIPAVGGVGPGCVDLSSLSVIPIDELRVETWYSVSTGFGQLHRVSVLAQYDGCSLQPVWAGWILEDGPDPQLQVEAARLTESPDNPKDRGVFHPAVLLEANGRSFVFGERTQYAGRDVSVEELVNGRVQHLLGPIP